MDQHPEDCASAVPQGHDRAQGPQQLYGAIKGAVKSSVVSNAMGDLSFYVLGPDLKARGISETKLIDGIKIVDYNGFVDLVTEHDTTQSWL